MKNIISKVAIAAAVTNSNDEIENLIAKAKGSITPFQVASLMVRNALSTTPLVSGHFTAAASESQQRNEARDNGGRVVITQTWHDACTVIAFNMVANNGDFNTVEFSYMLTDWASKEENFTCIKPSRRAVEEMASKTQDLMIRDGWVEREATNKDIKFDGGNEQTVSAHARTAQFAGLYDETMTDMQAGAQMKCEPLKFAPEPWRFEDGKVVGIHPLANMRFNKGLSKPSQRTLDIINSDMLRPLQIHPAMQKLARQAKFNPVAFQEIDGIDASDWKESLRVWDAMSNLQLDQDYYFPITLDHRGRQYYRGGVITPQGGNHCKAAFIDATKPVLGKSGYYALLVCFATAIGIKGSVKHRMRHTNSMILSGELDTLIALSPVAFLQSHSGKKNEKYQAYVLLNEIALVREWIKAGNDVAEFKSGVILHQDGTCNGMQHMAIITRNRATAFNVNVTAATHDDDLQDIYGICAEGAPLLKQYGRDCTKDAVMVAGYGASDDTQKDSVREWFGKQLKANNGQFQKYTKAHGDEIVMSVQKALPAINQVTGAVKYACEQILLQGNTTIEMTAKDGFKQVQQYTYAPELELRLGSFSCIKNADAPQHLNVEQMITATSPNMTHMNDGCHVRLTIEMCDWKIVTVHDSYGTCAGHYFETNSVLANTLADNYTDYCPVTNLFNDYGLEFDGFIEPSDALTLDEVRKAVNAFS